MEIYTKVENGKVNIYQINLHKNNLKAIRRKLIARCGRRRYHYQFNENDFRDREDFLHIIRRVAEYASLIDMKFDCMGNIEFYVVEYPELAICITDLLSKEETSEKALSTLQSIMDNTYKHKQFIVGLDYLDEIMQNIEIKQIESPILNDIINDNLNNSCQNEVKQNNQSKVLRKV